MNNKRMYGQFYTTPITNPFDLDVFKKWFKAIPECKKEKIIEPFAGSNNIIDLMYKAGFKNEWKSFDIQPVEINNFKAVEVQKKDTIEDFPEGFKVGITNPPYLAKNSATRRGLYFPKTKYDDLYKLALEVMLENLEYLAVIIPESFITSGLFHDRLDIAISLTCKMFDDTDCPVCLALFSPNKDNNDFKIYKNDFLIGNHLKLKRYIIESECKLPLKFNDNQGTIGINCIDNSKSSSIRFVIGNEINSTDVKSTSRSITRVSGLPEGVDLEDFIKKCNEKLDNLRLNTKDVFLTAFKGLREDNMYRRRLDYKTARSIINSVYEDFTDISNEIAS